MPELEYQIVETLPKDYFERILREAILKTYKKHIQKNYYVAGFAQIQSGEWVVCLRRNLQSFEQPNTASTPTAAGGSAQSSSSESGGGG